jgi:hypothetical protein
MIDVPSVDRLPSIPNFSTCSTPETSVAGCASPRLESDQMEETSGPHLPERRQV